MTLTRAEEYMKLWNILMPTRQANDLRQFVIWATHYSEPSVNRGLTRAVKKFGKNPYMDTPALLDYATGVMFHAEEELALAVNDKDTDNETNPRK